VRSQGAKLSPVAQRSEGCASSAHHSGAQPYRVEVNGWVIRFCGETDPSFPADINPEQLPCASTTPLATRDRRESWTVIVAGTRHARAAEAVWQAGGQNGQRPAKYLDRPRRLALNAMELIDGNLVLARPTSSTSSRCGHLSMARPKRAGRSDVGESQSVPRPPILWRPREEHERPTWSGEGGAR